MNYAAHYDGMMARARSRVLVGYLERHHVRPRCMGGGDEPANIVELTPEEHYIAHQLLVKMYPKRKTLAHAAVLMAVRCSGNKAYGWLRRKAAAAASAVHKGRKLPPRSAEWCARISVAKKGKSINSFSTEHRNKLSVGARRREAREDMKQRRAAAAKKNPAFAMNIGGGVDMTVGVRAKLSVAQKARFARDREQRTGRYAA